MMTLREETAPRSYREKLAWINLTTTLVLYVPFFIFAWRGLGALEPGAAMGGIIALHALLLPMVILQALLIGLGQAAFWLTGQRAAQEPADERDRAIDARATRAAYVSVVVVAGVGFYTLLPFVLSGQPLLGLPPGVMFSPTALLLLGFTAFVAAEVVRFGVQAVGHRRGF